MKTGIIGYGKMGKGIFGLLSATSMKVTAVEADADLAERANVQLEKRLRRSLKRGLMTGEELEDRLVSLEVTTDWDRLQDCDLVIEAAWEDLDTKTAIFQKLEPIVRLDCVLTTNTSSLPLRDIAAVLQNPQRFGGFHFFHPIPLSTIVEIIRWDGGDDSVVKLLRDVCGMADKTPIEVTDAPGSVLNGILSCYYYEGLYILEQGLAVPSRIDQLAAQFFRVGPCESIDIIGVEFLTKAMERTRCVSSVEVVMPGVLYRMIADGRAGRDAGKGIYLYESDVARDDEPAYYIDKEQKHSSPSAAGDDEALSQRLLFSIFHGILSNVQKGLGGLEDLSHAMRELLAMPKSPLELMRDVGKEPLRAEFEKLRQSVGTRFDPDVVDVL